MSTELAPTTRAARPATAGVLGLAGLLMAAGGQLHPIGEGDTLDVALASMMGSSVWDLAHLLLLAGLVVGVGGLALAYHQRAFGPSADRWLLAAIVGWGLGAVEMVPHLLAARDLSALEEHGDTPILDAHLMLQVLATPALGLTTAGLAIALARAARTKPAWGLAVLACVGGVGYGLAGPLINLTEDVEVAVLFAAEFAIALWMVGTAVRLWAPRSE